MKAYLLTKPVYKNLLSDVWLWSEYPCKEQFGTGGKDIGEIAKRNIERINKLIATAGDHKQKFNSYWEGLKKNLNPSVSQEEAVEKPGIVYKPVPVVDFILHSAEYVFVSNGAWLDGNAQDGFRKTIEKEFSSIYVFNLRENQRTSGELSRKEGGKIFRSGSRTPISITLLVRKKNQSEKARIMYYDIGDYLSREDKLKTISDFHDISNLPMKQISPNENGDWISKRSDKFGTWISIDPDKKFNTFAHSFFVVYSRGYETARDFWAYNSSESKLRKNIDGMINEYYLPFA